MARGCAETWNWRGQPVVLISDWALATPDDALAAAVMKCLLRLRRGWWAWLLRFFALPDINRDAQEASMAAAAWETIKARDRQAEFDRQRR